MRNQTLITEDEIMGGGKEIIRKGKEQVWEDTQCMKQEQGMKRWYDGKLHSLLLLHPLVRLQVRLLPLSLLEHLSRPEHLPPALLGVRHRSAQLLEFPFSRRIYNAPQGKQN